MTNGKRARYGAEVRREFNTLIVGAAVFDALAARALQLTVPTIGVLVVGSPGSERFWRLFREDMRELGYVEGKNVRYEFRSDRGDASRLPDLAAELVQLTSLARPGGNVTGMAAIGAELAGKCVDFIRELEPSASRIAALVNAPNPFSGPFLHQIQLNGTASETAIEPIMIHSTAELEAAFSAMEKERLGAVIVQPSLPIKRVVELAMRYRMPAVSFIREFASEGGLISYGPMRSTRTGKPRSTSTRS